LTPIKFTPFKNQAIANYRYPRGLLEGNLLLQSPTEWGGKMSRITINCQLCQTIEFPSHSAKKDVQGKAKLDSLLEFSLMYQWLKECIDLVELAEGSIKSDPDMLITLRLDSIYCRNASTEAANYLFQAQVQIKGRHGITSLLQRPRQKQSCADLQVGAFRRPLSQVFPLLA
jgi:hypothetical protein